MEVVNQKTNIKIYWKIFRGENKVTEDFHSMNTELKVFVVGTGNKYYMVPIINRDIEAGYDVIEIDIPARMLETGAYDLRAIWWKNKGRDLLTSNRCGIFGITDSAEEAPIEDLAVIKIASYTESFGRDGMSAYETAVMYNLHLGITSEKEWVMQETIRIQNENARKAAEEERKSNEASRVSEETKRVAAETGRKYAEDARVSQEATRKTAEEARNNAENARKASETTRVGQEYARINNENSRTSAENVRVSNENNRVEAEKKRVANETSREAAEDNREARFTQNEQNRSNRFNTAETARNANETSRVAAEGKRVVAESNRASNESTRVSNENQRIANENARKAAEEERQATYQSKLGKEDIVQTTGSSTDKVMSQKAVTDAIKKAGGGGGSSVTIVNNLTEGGSDKALSAEMGKTLGERIEEVAENGGGVPIVDSVDKLDPNAPQGSLATVATNTFREIKWSEIYQPTEEDLSQPFEEIVGKLTRISKFEVTPPKSMDDVLDLDDMLLINFFSGTVPAGFFMRPKEYVGYFGEYLDDYVMEPYSEDDVNYTWEVYHNIIKAANEELNKTPFYYIGCTINDEPTSLPFDFLDNILHIYTGEVFTELYIKTDKGWTPYKESDTVYIDYKALDEYDTVDFYEDGHWYYEIPIDEFPKVSQGVSFDELNKYKHVAFDGVAEPLMSHYGSHYSTPQYIYGEDDIWYGQHLEIFADDEYVYVSGDYEYMVKMPCRIYDNVEYLPQDAPIGTLASVKVKGSEYIPKTKEADEVTSDMLVTGIIPKPYIAFDVVDGYFKGLGFLAPDGDEVRIVNTMPGSLERIKFAAMWGGSMFYSFISYDLDGNLLTGSDLHIVNEKLSGGATITTPEWLLDSKPFMAFDVLELGLQGVLYEKRETGWTRYTIPTEMLEDGAVTAAKLSEDVRPAIIENIPAANIRYEAGDESVESALYYAKENINNLNSNKLDRLVSNNLQDGAYDNLSEGAVVMQRGDHANPSAMYFKTAEGKLDMLVSERNAKDVCRVIRIDNNYGLGVFRDSYRVLSAGDGFIHMEQEYALSSQDIAFPLSIDVDPLTSKYISILNIKGVLRVATENDFLVYTVKMGEEFNYSYNYADSTITINSSLELPDGYKTLWLNVEMVYTPNYNVYAIVTDAALYQDYNNLSLCDDFGFMPSKASEITEMPFSAETKLNVVDLDTFRYFTGITNIPDSYFTNSANLENIAIPDNVTSIGSNAFNGIDNLTSVEFSESNLQSIGQYAFYSCDSLEEFNIPSSVTSIGNYAFDYCSSLREIVIPEGVTSLGTAVFRFCKSTSYVYIPSSVTSITKDAFKGCTGTLEINCNVAGGYTTSSGPFYDHDFSHIILGSSVLSVGKNAFYSGNKLETVTIGENVTSIGAQAFNTQSGKLTMLTSLAVTPPTISANSFPSNITEVYVPDESLEAYKTATNWSGYADKIKPLSEYTEQ
jgi:hypothetical protein